MSEGVPPAPAPGVPSRRHPAPGWDEGSEGGDGRARRGGGGAHMVPGERRTLRGHGGFLAEGTWMLHLCGDMGCVTEVMCVDASPQRGHGGFTSERTQGALT